MSGWPIWRTAIGPARDAGLGPHWMGICGVLISVPLAGVLLIIPLGWLMGAAGMPISLSQTVMELGGFMLFTPVLSWAGLAIGVPLAILAARRGYGGWLAAGMGGALIGGVVALAMTGNIIKGPFVAFAGIGAAFALTYWVHARLAFPAAFSADFARLSEEQNKG